MLNYIEIYRSRDKKLYDNKLRFCEFNVKFDVNAWAKWAENYGLRNQAINFGLYYAKEIFESKNKSINPRAYTIFCNSISGIDNWADIKSLETIDLISRGCFNDENNTIGHLFTMFVHNNLDKLPSPEEMFGGTWETAKSKLEAVIYKDGNYRSEIASILSTRFLNYSDKYLSSKGSKSKVIEDRLLDIINSTKEIFTQDLIFNIVKSLNAKHSKKLTKLMMHPKCRATLLS